MGCLAVLLSNFFINTHNVVTIIYYIKYQITHYLYILM